MNWQWRSGEGIQQLVLFGGHGLSKREVGFGFVDSKNCAYDSWNRQEVGVYESGIEAKRNLIRHFIEKITTAPEDSKVRFDEGYIEGLEDAVKQAYMFIDKYGVVYDMPSPCECCSEVVEYDSLEVCSNCGIWVCRECLNDGLCDSCRESREVFKGYR